MLEGRTRYWAASVEASAKQPELNDALMAAKRKRWRHHALSTLLSFSLYAAFIGGAIFTFFYIGDHTHLEMAEFAKVGARAFVYFFASGLLMCAATYWIYLRRKFGLKLSRSCILWLRRFHKSDGEHKFFKRVFARATPLTFAVTLRDSKVMGSLEQGVRRATPALILAILLILGGVLLWETLNAACLAADHKCRVVDRIWVFDSAFERQDIASYDEVRPFTLVFALSMAMISLLGLVTLFAVDIAPRLGFVRPRGAEATHAWFDALRSEGSSNTTYVVSTADEHWQSIVEHLYRGSALVVFDLTHPSQHLDFELGLLGGHSTARAMFICRTTLAQSNADEATFRAFLMARLSPDLMSKLAFSLHGKRSLSEEIGRQSEASLHLPK